VESDPQGHTVPQAPAGPDSRLLGLVSASWPARRAARLDVLAAITAQLCAHQGGSHETENTHHRSLDPDPDRSARYRPQPGPDSPSGAPGRPPIAVRMRPPSRSVPWHSGSPDQSWQACSPNPRGPAPWEMMPLCPVRIYRLIRHISPSLFRVSATEGRTSSRREASSQLQFATLHL